MNISAIPEEVINMLVESKTKEDMQSGIISARAAVIRYCQDNGIEFATFESKDGQDIATMSKEGLYSLLWISIVQGIMGANQYWSKKVLVLQQEHEDLLKRHEEAMKVNESNARQVAILQAQIDDDNLTPPTFN